MEERFDEEMRTLKARNALKSLGNLAYKTQIHFYTVKMQKWLVIIDFEIHKHSQSKKKKKGLF